ncbi:MAG: phosphopantetheine-binding protein [Azospirillaceae bacterium]
MTETSPAAGTVPVETTVLRVFAEVLGRDAVAGEDDFVELGGTSLSAAIAVSKLEGALGVEIPLRLLMEDTRIGAFAERVGALTD